MLAVLLENDSGRFEGAFFRAARVLCDLVSVAWSPSLSAGLLASVSAVNSGAVVQLGKIRSAKDAARML